jgi:hypothetical protein
MENKIHQSVEILNKMEWAIQRNYYFCGLKK